MEVEEKKEMRARTGDRLASWARGKMSALANGIGGSENESEGV
jgi:hypothetical protein